MRKKTNSGKNGGRYDAGKADTGVEGRQVRRFVNACTRVRLNGGNTQGNQFKGETRDEWMIKVKGQCLTASISPFLCMPLIVAAVAEPERSGLAPNSSYLRPAAAWRPSVLVRIVVK
jgi:hypothetical protein